MNLLMIRVALAVGCLMMSTSVRAQIGITGIVSYKGKPLPDGYVSYDTTEVFTDSLGCFTITVDSLGSVLYVGKLDYRSMAYTVRSAGHHAIKLPKKYGKRSKRTRICGFCFTGDALVTMGDGSCKPIESVEAGNIVMSFPGDRPVPTRVDHVDRIVHDGLVRLRFSDGTELTATADHPFHVEGRGWCAIRPEPAHLDLGVRAAAIGDTCLRLIDGVIRPVLLVSIQALSTPAITYNLSMSGHAGNYFANGLLVSDESLLREGKAQRAVTHRGPLAVE